MRFAAVHESAWGTWRTIQPHPRLFASGVGDIDAIGCESDGSREKPKRYQAGTKKFDDRDRPSPRWQGFEAKFGDIACGNSAGTTVKNLVGAGRKKHQPNHNRKKRMITYRIFRTFRTDGFFYNEEGATDE